LSWFIRIDRNYLFGSFEITSIRLYTPVCTTWLRLFLHEPNKNCDQSLNNIILSSLYNLTAPIEPVQDKAKQRSLGAIFKEQFIHSSPLSRWSSYDSINKYQDSGRVPDNFDTVIGLSDIWCHNAPYSLNSNCLKHFSTFL
jgi:hypothetical protein